MNINPYVKDFIEEHIDLIEDHRFGELWEFAEEELTAFSHLVPHVLYEAGVNLMEYVGDTLPDGFMTDSDLKSIYVPDNISRIGGGAFSFTPNLEELSIPKKCQLGQEILFDSRCQVIDYRGTLEEMHRFTNLFKCGEVQNWHTGSAVLFIRTADGHKVNCYDG